MGDRIDEKLFEGLLLEEIELLSDVIIAAAASPERLTSAQVDGALGVVTANPARVCVPGQTRRDAIELAAKSPDGVKARRFWNREAMRAWRTSMDMADW